MALRRWPATSSAMAGRFGVSDMDQPPGDDEVAI
jgi:hypothetical protein